MYTSQYYVVSNYYNYIAIEHWTLFVPKTMQNKILNIFTNPPVFFFDK